MKKVACALLCIVHLLFPIARADSFPFELTDAIVQSAFGDPRWDGYRPVLHAMHAVENGSGVVVMGNEQGNNVLCVIEPRPEGWKIVVENEEIVPDAVFLDTHWLPDLFWMTDGAYYSFSLFPFRSKSGEHTLSFQKDANGEWIVRGFSFVPGYVGIAANLGYAQFGMYEGGDLPEGKLHSYAGKSTDASGPNEIYRRVIDRVETGLSFKLSEFVLRDYITALLGLYCEDAAVEKMLAYPVSEAEIAAEYRARYEKNGNPYTVYEAFRWERGFFFTWTPQDWAAFWEGTSGLEAAANSSPSVGNEILAFAASGYRMPSEGELSYDEALAAAKQLLAMHQGDSALPDPEEAIVRAVLIGTPPGNLSAMWKFAFFTTDYREGFVIQFDAQSGEETDYFLWDASVLARHLPFVYTEAGVTMERLESWYALTKYYHYNPNGGIHYHADPECPSVNSRYLPMQTFLRTDIGKEPYDRLTPCPYCVHE